MNAYNTVEVLSSETRYVFAKAQPLSKVNLVDGKEVNGKLECPTEVCGENRVEWIDTRFEKGDVVTAKVHHGLNEDHYFVAEGTATLENGAVDMMASVTAPIVLAFLSVSLF